MIKTCKKSYYIPLIMSLIHYFCLHFSLLITIIITFLITIILIEPLSIFAATNIKLIVKETLGIDRENEMIHNGIPIAKSDDIRSIKELLILNENGESIPAEFIVLSRWGGGKDDQDKAIQWLLLSFPVSIRGNLTNTFYLTKGIPAPIKSKIHIEENKGSYLINTGTVEFVINKKELTLFDSISLNKNFILKSNGGSRSSIHGQSMRNAMNPFKTVIERNNDHYVCIKVEGYYSNDPVGDRNPKPLSYEIRYEFFADSPTAIISHKFFWPGRNGNISEGKPITVDNVSLILPDMVGYESSDLFLSKENELSGVLIKNQTALIEQKLRNVFSYPHKAKVVHGNLSKEELYAETPILLNRCRIGVIAVTIDHMKYFEPQSIITDHKGKISINVLSENQHFSNYQGTWARIGLTILPPKSDYSKSIQTTYAPLNNRLFVFPDNAYVRKTKIFLELPKTPIVGSSNELCTYFNQLKKVTEKTKQWLSKEGFNGLMTWGALVRYNQETGTQIGWDKLYNQGKFSDYHNAWSNVIFQFLLEGDPSVLYDLSFMGARRMLHTQIMQPDQEQSDNRMGWGFSGYGRYREDGNSCHSYFDNLFTYYYFTGDMEVVDIMKVAGETMQKWYTRNSDGSLNDMTSGGVNWVNPTSRTGNQMASIFNFLGHSFDKKFNDDFLHMYNHAFSRSILLLAKEGKEYGFITNRKDNFNSGFDTEQFWMQSMYFMHNIYLLYNEWGDIELGASKLKISRVYEAIARTYIDYVSKVNPAANGTWNGRWINTAKVEYVGEKIGGKIISIVDCSENPPSMYNSGKGSIPVIMLRAGKMANDPQLTQFGFEGIKYITQYDEFINSGKIPWGKINGIIYSRFHYAMGYLNENE